MFTRLPASSKMSSYRQISPTTLLVFISVFVFSCFTLVNSFYRGNRRQTDNTWDLLIFTQNWPSSVCNHWASEGPDHTCLNYPNNTWTIHGLWPTKIGTIGPAFCTSKSFIPEAIYGLENELLQVWAPVEKHKKKYAFWSHEWEKHGTCASSLPALATEFDYFYKGIELIKKYNMNSVLQQAGIAPGQSYNITMIWDGVKNVLTKKPQVVCFEAKGGVSVLMEIRICFDKQFNLVDCDGTIVGFNEEEELFSGRGKHRRSGYQNLTNCQMEKFVQYPPGSPKISLTNITNTENTEQTENPLSERLKMLLFTRWLTG